MDILFYNAKIKKKILIVLLLSSAFCNTIFAQGTVKGLLINQHLQPIQNALAILQSIKNPKIAQTAFSNDSGKFVLSVDTGYYHFNIYLDGKMLIDTSFNLSGNINLGKVQINDTLLSNKIQEITITGKQPQISLKDGKLIFKPSSIAAGSVLDVLHHTPMVLVSQSGIGIVGKQGGTVVKINGRLKNMSGQVLVNYLRNISATDVASIEVQRTGFALQDAGDNSGIINIVLNKKEIYSGVDGNFYLGYEQAHYATPYGGVTLNWYQKKFQWTNTIGYYYGNTLINGKNDVYYPFTTDLTTERQKLKSNALNYSSKLAYQINKHNYFEADLDLNLMPQKTQSHIQSIFKVNKHLQADSSLIANNNNNQYLGQAGLTAYYKHQFDSAGNQMELTLNLIRYWFNRDQTTINQLYDKQEILARTQGIQSGNNQNLSLSTFNILFKHPGKWMNLQYGGKLTFISNHNHSDFYREVQEEWQPEFNYFDQFNYNEQTQALFIQGTKKIKKWDFLLGLRAEHTQTKGHSIVLNQTLKKKYWMLFPSANVSFNPNEQNSFSLSYSRKVRRPNFAQLNPFRQYRNQYFYFIGNPFLQPSYSHNIDFMYLWKQKWQFGASFERSDNSFSEVELTNPDSIQHYGTIDNFFNYTGITFNIGTDYYFFKRWQFAPQLYFSHYTFISKLPSVTSSKSFTGYFTLYNQVRLSKKQTWYFNVNGNYYLPNKSGIMQTKTMWNLDLGLTYRSKNQKILCSLYAGDIFKTSAFQYNSIVNGILRERYKYSDAQNLTFTFRYYFSRGKTQKIMQKKENVDKDLKRRLKQ